MLRCPAVFRIRSAFSDPSAGSQLPHFGGPLRLNAVKAPTPTANRLAALPALLLLTLVVGCQSGPRPAEEFVQQAEVLHQTALRQAVVGDRDLNDYFAEIGKRVVAGATAANAANTRDPTFAA